MRAAAYACAATLASPAAQQTARRHVIRGRDRVALLPPFGRGELVVGTPIAVSRGGAAVASTAACDAADRLCA